MLSRKDQISLVLKLSFPAIMAMISTIIMEYIDASMVGSLGSDKSAAIGVVSTTTWLVSGLCSSIGTGFTVGLAHRIGAGEDKEARKYVKSGFATVITFSGLLLIISVIIHNALPVWMGADESILSDASDYFLI
ncbi:MAG: MATE family efflux transporter, partial [Lachnospiraceae bacterium]|nr:MATE family efflux transporter [Lachnospiraceae bacterium]